MRLEGYVRVSQIRGRGGDSFISPAVQRERIEAWARAYGHELTAVHEELDQSGARTDRPLLLQALERVEQGLSDGLVVHKADRFGRSLIDGLQQIDRIRAAGGTFVSVTDGLDTSTETGRLVLRIMLSLAEHQLEGIRANWAEAKGRAVMRGIHPSATPPFGYRREGRGGRLLVDPVTGPLVTELFAKRAAGAGPAELAEWLMSQQVRTQWGREHWARRGIKDILRNEVYLGVAYARPRKQADGTRVGEEIRNPDAHEPLVDPETFAAAQSRGVQFRPRADEPSPIRPLLRCAGCRYAMRAERRVLSGGRETWYFTCRSSSDGPARRCEEPAAIRDDGDVERAIVEAFFAALPALTAQARGDTTRLGELEQQVARERSLFEQWRDDPRVQANLDLDDYLQGLAARKERLNAALAEFAREQQHSAAVPLPPGVGDLEGRWHELSSHEHRELLSAAIRCVFVRGSRRTASPAGRLRVVWHGELVDLPGRGERNFIQRPFRFD